MSRPSALLAGLLPALVIAGAVALLAAGLQSWAGPTRRSEEPPTAPASASASVGTPSPGSPGPASPIASSGPTGSVEVAVATRVVIPSEDIDLPVISRDLEVPGQGPERYPPCDVALYHTAFEQPGGPGTTYLYAHAREGMFLPLLEASERRDGAALIGALVEVYTGDDRMHLYQVSLVKRHAIDYSLALDASPDAEQLILQTSEGPRGTVPRLQVLALPVEVDPANDADAHPAPHPRACYSTP